MRATTLAAGGLACAGAAMTIAAFAGGGSDPPAAGAPSAARAGDGLTVWIEQGCGSCHTFAPANARMQMGPDLQLTLHDKSRDYILESIVLPDKKVSSVFSPGMMPDDYAQRIPPEDLDPLVDFIVAGVRAG